MTRVLLAVDSFKGTFSSSAIEELFARRFGAEGIETVCVPISDGGEGLIEALRPILGGEVREVTVTGPDFTPVKARYLLAGKRAVVETAEAAGITLSRWHSAADTTTYGVGETVSDAMAHGAQEILLGLGGSATTDGGCGMAAALGWTFFDEAGKSFVPVGRTLSKIARVGIGPSLPIVALTDVTNPLYGPLGASYVFAPQKGVREGELQLLDDGLNHLSRVLRGEGIAIECPGAGAAGGLGGMVVALGGRLDRGIDTVLSLSHFDELVSTCDYVVTGEGRLDSQSFGGKVIDGVLSRKGKAHAIALVGSCLLEDPAAYGLDKVVETNPAHKPLSDIADPRADLLAAIDRVAIYIKGERV